MRRRIARVAIGAVLAGCVEGGGPGGAPRPLPRDERAPCGLEKGTVQALVADWPAPDRARLAALARSGVPVVRHVGCDVEILERCAAPVPLRWEPGSGRRDRVTVRDPPSLYASLPVGAPRLETKLRAAGEIHVDLALAGALVAERAEVRRDELRGECASATHAVRAIFLGAFRAYAGPAWPDGGVPAADAQAPGREVLSHSGDEIACAASAASKLAPPPLCDAPVGVVLVPLEAPKK